MRFVKKQVRDKDRDNTWGQITHKFCLRILNQASPQFFNTAWHLIGTKIKRCAYEDKRSCQRDPRQGEVA